MSNTVDLHTHSTASDGTDSPRELMERAVAQGITTLALTDHDTLSGVQEALRDIPRGLRLVPGVEMSCRGRAGKCHILGLGVDPLAPELVKAVKELARLRREKLETRIRFLAERGIDLPAGELESLRCVPSAGKPHLAGLLIKYGFAGDREEAFQILRACRTGRDRIGAESAVQAILAAGGIPVWAHPRGGVDETVGEAEFRALLPELTSYGLAGLECFYSLYPLALCRELEAAAREKGLLISGGSDYHGENKTVPLGRLCAQEAEVPMEELSVLKAL